MTPELPVNIDSTMISCFRSCGQKFYEEFVLGLRPTAVSIDLHAGACFAGALEEVYRQFYVESLPLDKSLMRAYGKYLDMWGDVEPQKDTPKTKDRTWEAVEEYFKKWPPLTDPVQPYKKDGSAEEFTFAIPLLEEQDFPLHPSGQPFMYSGRFDRFGLLNGTKRIVRDEKTTTSVGASWASQWPLRSQFMGYCWACQQSGFSDVDTVCVRGIGILKTKFTLVDAYPTFPRHMIDKWYSQLRRDLWRIRRSWDDGVWDYNLAETCSSYGGCVFRDLCTSPAPERWRSQFTVRRWNPLQKNPVEEKVA